MSKKEVALTLPFSLDALGNITVTSDSATIWATRVKIAIETILGERVMRPDYGSKIPSKVFATTTDMMDTLEKEVIRVFTDQLPLLKFISVTFTNNFKDNILSAEIVYELPNETLQNTQVGVMTVSSTNPPYEELL